MPKNLLKYETKISIVKSGFTDFFMSYDNSKETILRTIYRNMQDKLREKLKERRESEKI
jgi:hypothetical protein